MGALAVSGLDSVFLAVSGLTSGLLAARGLYFVFLEVSRLWRFLGWIRGLLRLLGWILGSWQFPGRCLWFGQHAEKTIQAERFPNAKPNLILQNKIHKLPIAPCGPDVI